MDDIRFIYDIRETCYKVRNTTKVLNEVIFAAGFYHMPTSMITSYLVSLGLPGTNKKLRVVCYSILFDITTYHNDNR